jgi:MoaA/NifB/PqqE/SkfB family radical SAM enzyme
VLVNSDRPYTRIDLKKYAVIPVWYGCNSNCTICMLAKIKNRLATVDFAAFSRLVTALVNDGRYDSLILSGAEVTTFAELEHYIRFAASFGYFKKIQLQTNGRKLADKVYLRTLVAAGANEFFVSVHGVEGIHDQITRTPGAYAATRKGLDNLAQFPVNVISNTVLTRTNYLGIMPLLDELCALPLGEMHLWNYFPMERTDRSDLVVSIPSLAALFPGIMETVDKAGKILVLKGFPECIAPGFPVVVDSDFPLNLIQDDFWSGFAENGFGSCVYKEHCKASACWGLSSAYVDKYGDERALLQPLT